MENQEPVPADTSALPKNGHPKVYILSSNATLFWRVFVPVFGTVFFTGFLLALWLISEDDLYLPVAAIWPRVIALLLWMGWLFFIRRTLWRLKRVDTDDTHLYVTNYWTTVRYPWHDVERLEETRRMGRRIIHILLKSPGRFGQVISFLPGSSYDNWASQHH